MLQEAVHEAQPEVVVVAPCGYDLAGARSLASELVASGVLPAGVPVRRGRQRRLGAPRHPAGRRGEELAAVLQAL